MRCIRGRPLTEAEEADALPDVTGAPPERTELLVQVAGLRSASPRGTLNESMRREAAKLLIRGSGDLKTILGWVEEVCRRAEATRDRCEVFG